MTVPAVLLCAACAGGSAGSNPGAAPTPAAATATVMRQAAQTEAPKPRDVDPVGSYTVSLLFGGQAVDVTLEIVKRPDGQLGGAVYADQTPPIPLVSVTVSGQRVQASLTTPDGSGAMLDFTLDGDELAGTWSAASGDGSKISGRKLP